MLRCCSTLPLAIKLLVERVNSLHTFELTCCKVEASLSEHNFLHILITVGSTFHLMSSNVEKMDDKFVSTEPQPPDIGRLSSLSSNPYLPQLGGSHIHPHHHSRIHSNYPKGTSFDDFGLEQLGRHVPSLLTLNVARTRVSDRGLVGLQVWRVFFPHKPLVCRVPCISSPSASCSPTG